MPVTTTIQNVQPTVGGSADTWGGTINARLGEAYDDINALATQSNANQTLANAALPKAGGTMTGDVVLADVGPGDTRSVGFRGAPVVNFSADKTLALTDAGKTQRMTGATPLVLTIPPVGSVGFPVGTVIPIRNFGTAALTVARGSGVQLRLVGSATDKNCTVAPYGMGGILHESSNVWVIQGVGVS